MIYVSHWCPLAIWSDGARQESLELLLDSWPQSEHISQTSALFLLQEFNLFPHLDILFVS